MSICIFVCCRQGSAGAQARLVLSVMMPEAEQSVLSCDQLCGSPARLLNSLGTPGLPSHTAFITSKYNLKLRENQGEEEEGELYTTQMVELGWVQH